ncbi:LysM domain/BON superfamily protein [Ruminiclostridium hungatei]|uniref:LysM domain/BON superfamily protein n=1 Tax=Ruminiclostridium hungatei TaxID=48256 RepID=A0A1V4SKT1_RUMHU|nr:LysM domain-containing protein [Ruminiclostridium hungatei]OPX43831.1 LysM domain/BON superfamily protein [Ruminiclostridium hungatei]
MAYLLYMNEILMPVVPSKIEMKVKNQNSTLNLMNGREINIIKPPGLTEFSFELLIPQVSYPFAVYGSSEWELMAASGSNRLKRFIEAREYLGLFESLKKRTTPFPFKIERYTPDGDKLYETKADMDVTLEEYSVIEDASNGLDILVPVRLKQYAPYGLKPGPDRDKRPAQLAEEDKPVNNKDLRPLTYTVKRGDTLWGICKKYLGDGSKYPQIAKLNGISNPNFIREGQVIKLG